MGNFLTGICVKPYITSLSYTFQAVAWCPWQPNVLASGGGTADRHIRFWNCSTGSCLNAVDTKSQVGLVSMATQCISQWWGERRTDIYGSGTVVLAHVLML